MSQLVLKSSNQLDPATEFLDFTLYKQRVLADGGTIVNEQAVKDAFAFIYQNGLNEDQVFSATSANWGVKVAAGNPLKLYSLFSSVGDIVVTIGSDAAINYDKTTYNVPTVELKSSSANALITGSTGNVNNAGICVIARAPVLPAGSNYGSTLQFVTGELVDISDSSTAAESLQKRFLMNGWLRSASSEVATTWRSYALGYGNTGNIDATTLTDKSKWGHTATFIDSSGLYLYNAGSLITTDSTVTATPYKTGLKFNIGRGRNTGSTAMAYLASLYGNVAEAWCVINTTPEKMRLLSLRASQLYPVA
ncbi:hypothetical protein [Acinetobacter baumannii]|uniref:hypothetical protein n=1 Tax=Acinetobacter baumannii TaxID=470 RepID=UPI003B427B0C